ncbi:MAG TPA: fibronectin type III domain-containing protein [Acidimicrobiales bacterium]|nr:fibronectin type III domain-containing protein [Acidimicrobiales bacterium]
MRPVRRRLAAAALGAAGAATVLLGCAGVALAGSPSISIGSPADGSTVTTSTFDVSGTVSPSSNGGSITGPLQVTVTNLAGHPGYTTSQPDGWCSGSPCSFSVPVSGLAWNGAYSVAVSATETDPTIDTSGSNTHPVTVTSSFSLSAPPATPRNFGAVLASDAKSITLSWSPNSEPDLIGYQISRSPSSTGSWPAAVTGTRFVDDSVQPGITYTYSLQAVRQGADSSSAPAYSPSASASATTPPPPAPPASSSGTGAGTGSGSTSGASTAAPGGSTTGPSAAYFRSQPRGSAGSTQDQAASSLSAFQALLTRTRADTSAPALPAPQLPALPEDGVGQPGSDNPTVSPFSQGTGTGGDSARSALVTYESGGGGPSRFQTTAAVAMAALLVAIATHLIWLRRQINQPPA